MEPDATAPKVHHNNIWQETARPKAGCCLDATGILDRTTNDTPDMATASLEAGENAPCAENGAEDRSVWYRWTAFATTGAVIRLAGDQGYVSAAVYGPFSLIPSSVTDDGLPDGCVQSVGPGSASTEDYVPGTCLVQLVSDAAVADRTRDLHRAGLRLFLDRWRQHRAGSSRGGSHRDDFLRWNRAVPVPASE